MGAISIRGRSFHLAEILSVFAFGMLRAVTSNIGLGAAFRGAGWRNRDVFLLPEIAVRRFLADNCLCLVLPLDGLFCPLARLFHRLGGVLAALALPMY